MPNISLIIPCYDEADTLWFTLHSIQMHTRGTTVDRDGMEIVVADNGPGLKSCGRTVEEVCSHFKNARFPVRYFNAGKVQSPYYPRTLGAAHAAGEHMIFLDCHVLLTPYALEALHRAFLTHEKIGKFVKNPGIYMAHLPVAFDNPDRVFGPYSLRLRDDFWGGWTPIRGLPSPETYVLPIGASGIWCFSTTRSSWKQTEGFSPHFKGYAGGEVYLQLKHWLLGGHVFLLRDHEPNQPTNMCHGVHWSAPRRYAAPWIDRVRNVLLGVSVVAPDCLSEVTRGLEKKSGLHASIMQDLTGEAIALGAEEAASMAGRREFPTTAALEEFWKANGVFF